jgi:hypothetical protein
VTDADTSEILSAPLLPKPSEWSAKELADFLLRASQLLVVTRALVPRKGKPTAAAIAGKVIPFLFFGADRSIQETLSGFLRNYAEDSAALLSAALVRVLSKIDGQLNPDQLEALCQLLVDAEFDQGEVFANSLIDWLHLNGSSGKFSAAQPLLVYLVANSAGGLKFMPFIARLESRGLLDESTLEAALRVSASDQPSLLPFLVELYARVVKEKSLPEAHILEILFDLAERCSEKVVAAALVQLDPMLSKPLFNAAFSAIDSTKLFKVTWRRQPTGFVLLAEMTNGEVVNLSQLMRISTNDCRAFEWGEQLARALNRRIARITEVVSVDVFVEAETELLQAKLAAQMMSRQRVGQ